MRELVRQTDRVRETDRHREIDRDRDRDRDRESQSCQIISSRGLESKYDNRVMDCDNLSLTLLISGLASSSFCVSSNVLTAWRNVSNSRTSSAAAANQFVKNIGCSSRIIFRQHFQMNWSPTCEYVIDWRAFWCYATACLLCSDWLNALNKLALSSKTVFK